MPEDEPTTLDCVQEASNALHTLLTESCELPLARVADLAQDHGIKPIELLSKVDGSETCFVDYTTGHVRCVPAAEEGSQ